jgi:Tol biopolymer transport system component
MSDDHAFDRAAHAWLELGPTQAPRRVVEAALRAIDTTAQHQDLRVPLRLRPMLTSSRLAIAAAIGVLAIGSALVLLGRPHSNIAAPGPSPTASSSTETPGPRPDYSGLQGWIVFASRQPLDSDPNPSGVGQIWLVRADGSGLHELAPGRPAGGKARPWMGNFDISPDGTMVVFEGPGPQVWEVPIDGGEPTLLSTTCGGNGSGLTPGCGESDPTYSADGTKIAFVRSVTTAGGQGDTWVIGIRDLATGTVSLIESTRTGWGKDLDHWLLQPTWAPNGSRIAYQLFTRDWVTTDSELFDRTRIAVVGVDGSAPRELAVPSVHANAGAPDWSPDGSVILFSTRTSWLGTANSTIPGGIYTIRPDGDALTAACEGPSCLGGGLSPSWTPDGQHILFWAHPSWALMDPDGANPGYINEAGLGAAGSVLGPFDLQADGTAALLQPTP